MAWFRCNPDSARRRFPLISSLIIFLVVLPALVIVLLMLPILPVGCVVHAGWPVSGTVVDKRTGAPIANATVVLVWQGNINAIVDIQSTCYHVETATTDAKGHFSTGPWIGPGTVYSINGVQVVPYVYAPGYREADRFSMDRILMVPFDGARDYWLNYLPTRFVQCADAGRSMRNLLPMYERVYRDAMNYSDVTGAPLRLKFMKRSLEDLRRRSETIND